MLAKERQDIILNKINQNGIVYLKALSEELGVSICTVRRDFEKLEEQNLCKRVHGGAIKVKASEHMTELTDLHMDTRKTMNIDEKKRLCSKVADLIEDGDCVFIDGGTTFMFMIDYLKDKNVTIVTHNNLLKNDDKNMCTLYILGGKYSSKYQMNLGPMVTDGLNYFHFDKVFIGAAGYTLDDGNVYTAEIDTARVKQEAMARAQKKYLVIDSSKIGVFGFYTMTNIDALDGIVTTQNIESVSDKLIVVENQVN